MSQLRQNLKEVDQVTRAPIDSLTPNERKQRSMYMGKVIISGHFRFEVYRK